MSEVISKLHEAAQNNTAMIQSLYKSLAELGGTASELQQVLKLFGTSIISTDRSHEYAKR